MWLVDCDGCGRRRLCGADRVRAVENLAPGLIAVELACPCGRVMWMVTGHRLTGPAGRPPAARP